MLEWSASAMASALMTDDRHNHAAAREEEDGKSVLSRSLTPVVCLLQLVLTSHRRLCLTGWSLTLLVCMGVLFKSIDCGASAGF